MRCLDRGAVVAARTALTGRDSVTLPYRCKISGDEETLVLVSGRVAGKLADSCSPLKDPVDAVLTAAVCRTELCVCDLAAVAGLGEEEAHTRLERLVDAGALAFRIIDGMNYFRLAEGRVGDDIRAGMQQQIPQE